jgi:hypothetical protein
MKQGPAAVGESANDYWNVYSRDVTTEFDWRADGQISNLLWADGSASGIDLSVNNAAGAWFSGSTDPMMDSYLYPLSRTGNMTVTLTKVPPGSYDLYFYAHGEPPGENGVVTVESGGVNYGTESTSTAADWDPPMWVEGKQFVLFSRIQALAGQAIVVTVQPGSAGLAVMNGLQLQCAAPVSASIAATPSVLWPPNHKMVPISLKVTAASACGQVVEPTSARVIAVTSDQPQTGPGNAGRNNDWTITGDMSVELRAERLGGVGPRHYTITVAWETIDGATGTSDATVAVLPPE